MGDLTFGDILATVDSRRIFLSAVLIPDWDESSFSDFVYCFG